MPLRGLDRKGLVIAVGTFSKILFPGLRVGWIVAPPEVMERLIVAKRVSDFHTSALIQAAIYHFCRRRLLDRHMERMRLEYRRRRDTLLEALRQYCPADVTWTHPQGGFSLLLTLPSGLDTQSLLPEAASAGVLYTPGTLFYAMVEAATNCGCRSPKFRRSGSPRACNDCRASCRPRYKADGVCARQTDRRPHRWSSRGWARERLFWVNQQPCHGKRRR